MRCGNSSKVFLLVLLIFLLLFVKSEVYSEPQVVPIEAARKAAIYEASTVETLFEEWKGATIPSKNPVIFYDLTDTPFAYIFEVVKYKTYEGYITISARKDFYPLLDASTGPIPTEHLEDARRIADKFLNVPLADKPTLIYLRKLDYLVEFLSESGDKNVVVSLTSKTVIPREELEWRQSALERKAAQLKFIAEAKWERIEQLQPQEPSPWHIIPDVEPYTWYRGCAPTTMAMMFNYYGNHGCPNLRHTVSTFDWNGPSENPRTCPRELVDHFADYFGLPKEGEGDYGVTQYEEPLGFTTISQNHGYTFTSEIDDSYSYTTFQNEIDNNRPIKIDYLVDGDPNKGHAVCGYGYNFEAEHLIGVYNTWDLDPHVMTCENEDIICWVTAVPPLPNPTITKSLQLLQSPPYYVGDTITATFTIKNKGTAPITFKVLTTGGRGPGGDTDVQDFTHRTNITLNPSESYNYQGDLTLPKPGNYHFFCAYQTPDDKWDTAIPTEPGVINTLDIVVQPSAKPDLTVTSVTAPSSAKPGDLINVSFTIKNQGSAPSGPFNNRISLSTEPYGTHILLDNFSMDSIDAGSSVPDTKSVQMPDSVSPGDYYVTVFTDCYQVIDESNEGNNIGSTYPNMISIGPTDTTPPTIITQIPAPDDTNVPITTNIQVTFSEPMNKSATESAFSITPTVAGSKSWQGNTLIFNPTADLEYKKTYKVTITSSATDLAGNPLAHTEWSFTTIEEGTECFWADLDCDEDVDTEDVRIIAIYWDTQVGDPLYDAQYDFNSDGRINLLDVRMVAQYWGQTAPFDTAAPSIVQVNSNPREVVAYLQANLPEVRIGEITTVEEKFQGMELHLSYDPQKLEATYAGLEKRPSFIILGPRINQNQGTVAIGAVLLGKQEISALTSEILSAVKFTAQQERDSAPRTFALGQNFPNPFNPDTWIPYQLAESSNVQIKIYNVSGQLIKTLHLGYKEAGYYQNKASATYWDGRNETGEKIASGVYFYTIKAGKFTASRKMLLIE